MNKPNVQRSVQLNMKPAFDMDEYIEELEIMLTVCKRLRDKRRHNKRCCMNCKFLNSSQSRYFCGNEKVTKLMENPVEFDFEADLRTFVCPFMEFSTDDTKIKKYLELKKLLQS